MRVVGATSTISDFDRIDGLSPDLALFGVEEIHGKLLSRLSTVENIVNADLVRLGKVERLLPGARHIKRLPAWRLDHERSGRIAPEHRGLTRAVASARGGLLISPEVLQQIGDEQRETELNRPVGVRDCLAVLIGPQEIDSQHRVLESFPRANG